MLLASAAAFSSTPRDDSALAALGGSQELVRRLRQVDESGGGWGQTLEDGVVVYEPSDFRTPWAVVHFVGGAGLGTYPDVAYGALLSRLCDAMGVGCLATPFELTLDHATAANSVDVDFRRALKAVCRERAWPTDLQVFGLGHSLGCKLLLLLQSEDKDNYRSLGFVSANNFGLADSARLVRDFLAEFGGGRTTDSLSTVVDVALLAVTAAGIDVSPNPMDTLDILRRAANLVDVDDDSPAFPAKFVSFDDDDLDSTPDILDALDLEPKDATYALPGGHLSPVFINEFRLGNLNAVDALVDTLARALVAEVAPRRRRQLYLPP